MFLHPALVVRSRAETQLVFVRHGETLANASGHYSKQTLDEFSRKGQSEVDALTVALERLPRFQLILVSPSPRALKTIAPYLEKTGQKAMIWPLLYECCTGRRPKNAVATSFGFGAPIKVPNRFASEFVLMANEKRFPSAPTYNAGLAQIEAAVKEFNRSFRGKRVLLVGHSGQGGHFLHSLTGRWKKLDNAKIESFILP